MLAVIGIMVAATIKVSITLYHKLADERRQAIILLLKPIKKLRINNLASFHQQKIVFGRELSNRLILYELTQERKVDSLCGGITVDIS